MKQFELEPFVYRVEMGLAAPYSVGTSLPSLQRLPSLKPQICNNYSSPVSSHRHVKCALQLQPQTPPPPTTVTVAPDESLVKRRTLIGLFAFDAVLAYSSLNSSSAAETPCEFQVAPSGLAFCDKVVGAGSQAVKGQLIKVFPFRFIGHGMELCKLLDCQ